MAETGWSSGLRPWVLEVRVEDRVSPPHASSSCPCSCLLLADRRAQHPGSALLVPQPPARADGGAAIFTVTGCNLEEGIASGHAPWPEL